MYARRLLVQRVLAGRPVAHVAAERGISRPTAYKWIRRQHRPCGLLELCARTTGKHGS
ncbi:helix-turn-helix domain-containing protein [Nonomuraea recticatena]